MYRMNKGTSKQIKAKRTAFSRQTSTSLDILGILSSLLPVRPCFFWHFLPSHFGGLPKLGAGPTQYGVLPLFYGYIFRDFYEISKQICRGLSSSPLSFELLISSGSLIFLPPPALAPPTHGTVCKFCVLYCGKDPKTYSKGDLTIIYYLHTDNRPLLPLRFDLSNLRRQFPPIPIR